MLVHLLSKFYQKDDIWLTLYLSHSFLLKDYGCRGRSRVILFPTNNRLQFQAPIRKLVENKFLYEYFLPLIISYIPIFRISYLSSFHCADTFFFSTLFPFFPFSFLFSSFNFSFTLSVRVAIFQGAHVNGSMSRCIFESSRTSDAFGRYRCHSRG